MDVYIYTMPLPGKIKECVTQNEDGTYTVFIQESLSPADRARALAHARRHINCLHFEGDNVQAIEKECHGEALHRDIT